MLGRSRCMHCGHTLSALDLVPVISFLYLRGRCRYCHARLSLQYPLVEATAAALSGALYVAHPEPLLFALWLSVWMTLLFVVVYDLRHQIIPWSCTTLLVVLSLAHLAVAGQTSPASLLAGPILAAPLFLISLISWGRWMGWGDGFLELSLGWLLGLSGGLTALMLGFWSGAVVGVFLLFVSKIMRRKTVLQFSMRSEVPFAPFLVLGAFVVHFFHVDFFQNIWLLWL